MKTIFLWPGIYMGFNILGKGFEQSAMNHGLASISASLKKAGHECTLLDLRAFTGWEHFESVLKQQTFDVALMGMYSVDEKYAIECARMLKTYFPDKPLIVGGVHITYCKVESFPFADCVVWGEGDKVTLDLLSILEQGRPIPKKVIAPMIEDLNVLPFVDRELFTKQEQDFPLFPLLPKPHYTVNFSRGCPWKCTFCAESLNVLWKKYRVRSPENCIAELKTLEPIGSLMIHDDHLPTGNWIYKFIELWDKEIGRRVPFWCQIRADWIVKHKDIIPEMARIGFTWNSLGIEGSQRMLDFYNKRLKTEQVIEAADILHANKINIFGNYIIAAPTETQADLDELERIIDRIRPQWHSPSTYTSYPGSVLYSYVKENDLWVGDIDDPNSHYGLGCRYPYERKIKSINYEKIFQLRATWPTKYKGELLHYGE